MKTSNATSWPHPSWSIATVIVITESGQVVKCSFAASLQQKRLAWSLQQP